ncbi:MAG: hypothetical protein U0V74_15155 [Chitinophagales bacterium]
MRYFAIVTILFFLGCNIREQGHNQSKENEDYEKIIRPLEGKISQENLFDKNKVLREKGFTKEGKRFGVWLTYNPERKVTGCKYYDEGLPYTDVNINCSDYEVTNYKVDSDLEFVAPKFWKKRHMDDNKVLLSLVGTNSRDTILPQIVVYRGELNELTGLSHDSVESTYWWNLQKQYGGVELRRMTWRRNNVLVALYRFNHSGLKIIQYDIILISKNAYYIIYYNAYDDDNGSHLKYDTIYIQLLYSLRLFNKNLF